MPVCCAHHPTSRQLRATAITPVAVCSQSVSSPVTSLTSAYAASYTGMSECLRRERNVSARRECAPLAVRRRAVAGGRACALAES